jgi:hypothetical protein
MTNRIDAAVNSLYVKNHRAEWSRMGFAPMTVSVHDSDKEHAKALIELLRFERLMRSIEAGDAEVIDFVAGRNMQRLPSNEVLRLRREAVLYAMLPKPTENKIVALLDVATTLMTDCMGWRRMMHDDPANDTVRAKCVCANNLAVAHALLASALMSVHCVTPGKAQSPAGGNAPEPMQAVVANPKRFGKQ